MSGIELWNSYMTGYDFLSRVDSYQAQLRDIADALGKVAGKRILDAGSGTGNLSIFLKERGATIVACDASESALEIHRQKDPHSQILKASLEAPLPLEDGSFDGVCCVSVLFALSSQGCALALKEFHRLLRPGGILVLSVPTDKRRNSQLFRLHFQGQIDQHGWLRGVAQGCGDLPPLIRTLYYGWRISRLPDWKGFHHFDTVELKEMFQRAGFDEMDVGRTYGGASFLVTARRK